MSAAREALTPASQGYADRIRASIQQRIAVINAQIEDAVDRDDSNTVAVMRIALAVNKRALEQTTRVET